MKQLLTIVFIGLVFGVCGQNRYSKDEVDFWGNDGPNDTITYLKIDMKPLNGVVYCEFGDIGKFVNGKPDGLYRRWSCIYNWRKNRCGKVYLKMEVYFVDGKEDGLSRTWYKNGQLHFELNYKDGKRDGLYRSWHENGQLEYEGNFKDGKRDGLCRRWYENGQIVYQGNYKDVDGEGLYRCWYENGQLKEEINSIDIKYFFSTWSSDLFFEGDGAITRRVWYKNGQIKYEYNFKKEMSKTTFKCWDENGNEIKCNSHADLLKNHTLGERTFKAK